MTAWYKVGGDLLVRKSDAIEELVDDFREKFGVDLGSVDDARPDGNVLISVGFGDMFSNGTAEEIDDYLRQFAEHVVEPAFLDTDLDGDDVKLYIGPKDAEAAAQSKDTRATIAELFQYLLPHDARAIIADLQSLPGVAYEDDSVDLGKLRSVREVQIARLAYDCRHNGVMLEAINGEYGFKPNRDKDIEKLQKLQAAANGQ